MQKGQTVLWIVVGILVMAVVAGGAYYLGKSNETKPSPSPLVAQTPQPTQLLSNERNICFDDIGFCATIPSSWKSIKRSYGLGGGIPAMEFECSESQNEDIYSRSPFDVAKYESNSDFKLESIIFCSADACGFNQFGWTREDKVINGKRFIFINHNNSKDPLGKDVYYEVKNGYFKFRFGRSSSPICFDKADALGVFTKLLETFRLINSQ